MPGHIEKRAKNSWTIVVEAGRDPATGKRKRIYRAFQGTKREAERELARLIAEVEKGTYIEPSKLTFGEYLLDWLESYGKPNLAPSTFTSYSMIVRRHLIPALGTVPLEKLQPMHLQQYYSRALRDGRWDGKGGLSSRTVQYHHRIIHEALNHAVRWQIIPRNVADAVQAPRPKRPEIGVPSLEDVRRLLEAARDHQDYAVICTAVFTGMRRGELLGLKWEDVDLAGGTIAVRRTLQRLPGHGFVFTDPKSQRSRRQIVIPQALTAVLREHRRAQRELRLLHSPAYRDHDLVFPRPDGGPQDPNNLTNRFKTLAAKVGLAGLRFHDLRHLHATILLAQGIHPKIVQERLGHQSITLTLDTYSHVVPTLQREAADALEKLFGRQMGGNSPKSSKKGGDYTPPRKAARP